MLDLRTQLRSYVDGTIERIDVNDVVATASNRPGDKPRRTWFRRPAVALAGSAMVVLFVIGGTAWLVRGDGAAPSSDPTASIGAGAPEADAEGLVWQPVAGVPDVGTVHALVPNCCQNIALGADSWMEGFGESFTGPGAQPIPPEIGQLRSLATNGIESVAVPAIGPSTEPYVALYELPSGGVPMAWRTAPLPTDVASAHPDVVMHYTVESVAHNWDGHSYAVYGRATPEVDPAAVAREYPELAPVILTDLLPPCCDGEPMTTEIADPLWVRTAASSEPTAISLGTLGLTPEDLRGSTGVVWTFNRPSAPAPWVATSTLVADDVGPESFIESGSSGGFVLLTGRTSGGYDTWTSPSGANWTKVEAIPGDVVDIVVWKGRALVLTADGAILELQQNHTWATFVDAGAFDLPDGEPADPVRIEAGDIGVVVIGEREAALPWSGGEPIPTAQILWFSADGSTWSHQELSNIYGDIGAVEILVTRHQGHRDVPPTVIAAFGTGQANGEPIINPQWWAAQTK